VPKSMRRYYELTKPGIIRGNAIHVIAGALLASMSGVDWNTLLSVLAGTSLVIASACVVNNYMDRGIDSRMKRTKTRPSVTGSVPLAFGIAFAAVLLVAGFWVLAAFTNLIVVMIGVVAYIMYVFVYGWAKRHTVHSTLVGAIPGALPAMAGYVAVDGRISVAAILVFLLVVAWQMPHFYAISIFRRDDYEAAGLPVLGVVKPFETVRRHMLAYILAYAVVVALLIQTDTVGAPAGLLLLAGSAYWLYVFRSERDDERAWARSVFGASLVLTLVLLVAAALNAYLTPM
jgi:protoheme IX farnesyltransferase